MMTLKYNLSRRFESSLIKYKIVQQNHMDFLLLHCMKMLNDSKYTMELFSMLRLQGANLNSSKFYFFGQGGYGPNQCGIEHQYKRKEKNLYTRTKITST